MTQAVDFWFDATCPWAWMTSRWMLEVEKVRDVTVTFRPFSLAVLNEDKDINEDYRARVNEGLQGARAMIGARELHGDQAVRELYTALGTRYHPGGEPTEEATLRSAVADAGLDENIVERAATEEWDALLRESHRAGIDLVGNDVGVPILSLIHI